MDLALFFISGQTIAFVPKKSAPVKPTKQNFYFVGIIIEKLDYFFLYFHCRSQYKSFGFTDVFQKSVLYPFLVILVLMFLLQFSGQGAVTFYTASIFEEAQSSIDPNDCALVIGVTYFLSSILGLVLKKHVGRRILLLASELGMAVSQLAMGIYFYVLTGNNHWNMKRAFFDYCLVKKMACRYSNVEYYYFVEYINNKTTVSKNVISSF